MGFFVYILANSEDAELYKGFTENPLNRLLEHNAHGTQYTSKRRSWRYVYLSEFSCKKEAKWQNNLEDVRW